MLLFYDFFSASSVAFPRCFHKTSFCEFLFKMSKGLPSKLKVMQIPSAMTANKR